MKILSKGNIPNELYRSKVVLYGAGTFGKRVLSVLQAHQLPIKYIIDDNESKWGNKIGNIEIISFESFEKMCKKYENIFVIIATIYGKSLLKKINKISNISVYEMYRWIDEEYEISAPVKNFNNQRALEKFRLESHLLENKLEDVESKRVLEGLVSYIFSGDRNILSNICTEDVQYFIPEVLSTIRKPIDLLDGGAFEGELYQSIIENNIKLKHWYCFEADSNNYDKLLKKSEKYKLGRVQECIRKGLWDTETILYFEKKNDTSSKIVSYKTENQIETISIDSFFENRNCDFIKMDIEGAEFPALKGGIKIIKRDRPILAISIYHSLEDYYKIPNYLMGELCNYRYYIRHHAMVLCETVLYAIPNELSE